MILNAGLIRTGKRKHHLSSFGIVAYEAQKLFLKGMQEYEKLNAINSIEQHVDTAEVHWKIRLTISILIIIGISNDYRDT